MVELLRWLAGAGRARCGWSVAAQGVCAAEQGERARLGFVAAAGWLMGRRGSRGTFKGERRGSRGGVPGVIPTEIAGGSCCATREAGKKGLTRGPGVSERGSATLRWGNGADGWARPVIRLARARAEGASGLSGVGARGGPGRVARCRLGKRTLGPSTGLDQAWRCGLGRVGSSWAGKKEGRAGSLGWVSGVWFLGWVSSLPFLFYFFPLFYF